MLVRLRCQNNNGGPRRFVPWPSAYFCTGFYSCASCHLTNFCSLRLLIIAFSKSGAILGWCDSAVSGLFCRMSASALSCCSRNRAYSNIDLPPFYFSESRNTRIRSSCPLPTTILDVCPGNTSLLVPYW